MGHLVSGNSRVRRAATAALVGAVCLAGACGGGAKPAAPPPVPVTVLVVHPEPVSRTSEYLATLVSRQAVEIRPQVVGVVTKIFVRAGDPVRAGQPVFLVDPERQKATVGSLEAATASNQASVNTAQSTLDSLVADKKAAESSVSLAEKQYERYKALAESGDISPDELDRYRTALDTAKANLAAIDARIKAQKAEIARAGKLVDQAQLSAAEQRVSLRYFTVESPIAGIVGDLPAKVGDYVTQASLLTTITQNQPLECNVSIPVDQAAGAQPGTRVELVDGAGTKLGDATIFFVAPAVTDGTQSVLAKAQFPNEEGHARAEQQVTARVVWADEAAITVPVTCIVRVGAQNFVWIAEDGDGGLVARQHPVTLGPIAGNAYVVTSGLSEGQQVITSGIQRLADGARVEPGA